MLIISKNLTELWNTGDTIMCFIWENIGTQNVGDNKTVTRNFKKKTRVIEVSLRVNFIKLEVKTSKVVVDQNYRDRNQKREPDIQAELKEGTKIKGKGCIAKGGN